MTAAGPWRSVAAIIATIESPILTLEVATTMGALVVMMMAGMSRRAVLPVRALVVTLLPVELPVEMPVVMVVAVFAEVRIGHKGISHVKPRVIVVVGLSTKR